MGQKAASPTSQAAILPKMGHYDAQQKHDVQPDYALSEQDDGVSSFEESMSNNGGIADSASATSEFDSILECTIDQIKVNEFDFELADEKTQYVVQTMIAKLYILSVVGLSDPQRHAEWVSSTEIAVRIDTPHHKKTVRAALKQSGTKLFKSSEDDYALQLRAMEHERVPPSELEAETWLGMPLFVKGKKLMGKRKARHVLQSCASYRGEVEDRKAQKALAQEEIYNSVYAKKIVRPFGNIAVIGDEAPPVGVWLSFNYGEKVLAVLSSDEPEVASLVARFNGHC